VQFFRFLVACGFSVFLRCCIPVGGSILSSAQIKQFNSKLVMQIIIVVVVDLAI
jgi:hypothetical protein